MTRFKVQMHTTQWLLETWVSSVTLIFNGWWLVLILQSLVRWRVILVLKLKQVHGHLVSERGQFVVQVLLLGLTVFGVLKDWVVHGGEVIKDHELFEVRYKLHQRFSCSHLWQKTIHNGNYAFTSVLKLCNF